MSSSNLIRSSGSSTADTNDSTESIREFGLEEKRIRQISSKVMKPVIQHLSLNHYFLGV